MGAAELPLLGLLRRLAVDAERGDRARLQPLEADALAALLALAVRAVFDAADRLVDLGDELALTVADAEREVAIRLERGAIGGVGEALAAVGHAVDGAIGFGEQLRELFVEQLAELLEIVLVHGLAVASNE